MNRQRMLTALQTEHKPWDLIIIGGGATGLGSALEAATRGLRVALLEAHDFAKGTSSRSTKLIHGGVRYLRQGQINMVRQSLHERGRLRRNAPHIVTSRKFVIPSYQLAGRLYYYLGMKAYDLLAGPLGFEASRLLSTAQTISALPTIQSQGLRGGVAYADGQFDDARLAIALAQTAVDQGAVLLNYAPVVRLLRRDGRMAGVVVRDVESQSEFEVSGAWYLMQPVYSAKRSWSWTTAMSLDRRLPLNGLRSWLAKEPTSCCRANFCPATRRC